MPAPLAFDLLALVLAWLVRALVIGLAPPPTAPSAPFALGTDLTLSGPLTYLGRIDGAPYEHFGWTVTTLDDLDGDGARELVIGDLEHTGGGPCAGAVHVLAWRPERK